MDVGENVTKCICEPNKTFENDEYLDIENCSYEKRLPGKLALNTTETSFVDKK